VEKRQKILYKLKKQRKYKMAGKKLDDMSIEELTSRFEELDLPKKTKEFEDDEEKAKWMRKKIRHAEKERVVPKKTVVEVTFDKIEDVKKRFPKKLDRIGKLWKLLLRPNKDKGGVSLKDLASYYDVKDRTKLKKAPLLGAILLAEESTDKPIFDLENPPEIEPTPKKGGSKKTPKKTVVQQEIDDAKEDEEEPVTETPDQETEPTPELATESPETAEPLTVVPEEKDDEDEAQTTAGADAVPDTQEADATQEASESKYEPKKDCGEYAYEDLLNKRLEELRKILAEKGIEDSADVQSVEHGADLVCSMAKHNSTCDEKNDYECPEDMACDVSSKPGICVQKRNLNLGENSRMLEYKGRQIIGSKKAISALRKKLGLAKTKIPSDRDDVRGQLIALATQNSGKPESFFKSYTDEQLNMLLEGMELREKYAKKGMIRRLAKQYGQDKGELKAMDKEALRRKLEELRKPKTFVPVSRKTPVAPPPRVVPRLDPKERLIRILEEPSRIPRRKLEQKSLAQLQELAKDYDIEPEEEKTAPVVPPRVVPPKAAPKVGHKKASKPETLSGSQEVPEYSREEIANVVTEVIQGEIDPGKRTEIEKAVLKCLGLLE